jgi:hypothetical protein
MPIPWPAELLPEAVLMGVPMAIAACLVGAWLGSRLGAEQVRQVPQLRTAGVAGATIVALLLAIPLLTSADKGVNAAVALRNVDGGAKRTVMATVTLRPSDAAKDAKWLTATAWQGGGLVVNRLREIGPGVYRTTKPIPVYGDWKTMIRLHSGSSITGLPIYAPADAAIPAPAVPAQSSFTRPFFSDKELLQREAKTADPAVSIAAYTAVLTLTLLLLAGLAWGVHRVAVTANGGERRPEWTPPQPVAPPEPERVEEELIPFANWPVVRS